MTQIIRATRGSEDFMRSAIVELHGREISDEAAPAEFLSDPNSYLLLALEDDRVVGSLLGHALRAPHRRKPQFLLYEIDVRSECRNRGIGTALVQQFLAEARAAGAFEVWVVTNESNQAAMALYFHCGLVRANPDDVMLSLSLDE